MPPSLNPRDYRSVSLSEVISLLRAVQEPRDGGYLADDAPTNFTSECLQSWKWVTIAGDMVIFERIDTTYA
jgi:hypothetical protein